MDVVPTYTLYNTRTLFPLCTDGMPPSARRYNPSVTWYTLWWCACVRACMRACVRAAPCGLFQRHQGESCRRHHLHVGAVGPSAGASRLHRPRGHRRLPHHQTHRHPRLRPLPARREPHLRRLHGRHLERAAAGHQGTQHRGHQRTRRRRQEERLSDHQSDRQSDRQVTTGHILTSRCALPIAVSPDALEAHSLVPYPGTSCRTQARADTRCSFSPVTSALLHWPLPPLRDHIPLVSSHTCSHTRTTGLSTLTIII